MSLNGYPTEYLHCRTFGHNWEEFVPVSMRRPQFGFRFSLLCTTCGTERHELIASRSGQLLQRAYEYPDGYSLDFRPQRDECRVVLKRRRKGRVIRRGPLELVR
jgi:hypothetical protein